MRHYYMYLSRVLINVLPKKYIVGDIFYVNWGLLTVRGSKSRNFDAYKFPLAIY